MNMIEIMVKRTKLSNGKAKTSMILGISSIILSMIPILGLLSGIFAIVFYVKSRSLIIKDSHKYGGGKLSLAGLITGIVGIVFSLLIFIYATIVAILLAVTQ
jgi:hypothetical protein